MSAVIAHRCRFAEYVPKAIIAIAFSADGDRMALARYDGDIELWNHGNGEWFAERIIVNKESVRSLLWVRMNGEDRLFSSGLTGNIVEWDLTTSRQKHTSDSYAGPVWSIAVDPANNLLAAACDDGLRLFDISNGDIQFKKSFNKGSGGRLLSVAWSKEGDTLYTGDINGLVRQWKLNSQTSTLTMRLAKVESRCHIWAIIVLQDGSVVTGDSRGVLSVWDPQTTTEIYSRKTHDADILSMSCIIRPNSEIVVLASGVDSTMGSVRRLPNSGPSGYEWSMGGKFRHHRRDVFALAINKKETVASGGVDGSLHFLPLSSLVQAEKHQDLVLCSPLPPRPIVSFSASQRRFLLKDSSSVLSVWKAGREIEGVITEHNKKGKIGSAGATVPIEEMPRNLLKIQIKTGEKLISHALSPNGKMIACADTEAVKIFRIDEKKSGRHGFGEDVRFSVQKMEIPNAELAAWVAWVGDDYVVAGGFNGGVQLIDVMNKPSVVATCAPDWTRPAVAWTGVVATSDKYVAAVRAGGVIDLYHIDKSGDQIEFKSHGSIPSPSPASGVSALAFQPNSLRLFGMRQGVRHNKPFFFDVEAMANYEDKSWVVRTLPVYAFTSIQFDPSDNERVMLTSPTCIVLLKLSTLSYRANLKQFENVMHSSFSEDGKALYVVERPSVELEAKLPAPLIHHHNYGKS